MTHKLTIIVLLFMVAALCTVASADDKEGKINLNKATAEELAALPGITEEIAAGIVELREERGEFVDIMELLDVDGIDNRLLRKLERLLYIEAVSDCNC